MTPEKLADEVLVLANSSHIAHLASRSYAEHMALREFCEGVRESVDALIEAMIGENFPVPGFDGGAILAQIEKQYKKLCDERDGTCQGCPTLENLYDELTGVYVKAMYKLKRFK